MSFINYLLQVNIYLAVYFIFYRIFLSRETFFVFNRWFLLSALLTCIFLPVIKVDWFSPLQTQHTAYQFIASLNEVAIGPDQPASPSAPSWNLLDLVMLVYWTGVLAACLLMLRSLRGIYRLLRKNTIRRQGNYNHVILSDNKQAFSFWRFLFAENEVDEKIFLHEMVHIRQKHSMDILLIEMLKVFCWFNPFIYLYKKQVNAVHEYIADETATRQSNKYEYAGLLVSRSFDMPENIFIHTFFNSSLLKKRLIMLQKTKSRKAATWKYALSLPIVAAFLFISSTTFALKKKINTTLENMREVRKENLLPVIQSFAYPSKKSTGVLNQKARVIKTGSLPAVIGSYKDSTLTVSGRVVDENGNGIAGASIQASYPDAALFKANGGPVRRFAGRSTPSPEGTISNDKGYYTLVGVPVNGILSISMLGFKSAAVAVNHKPVINISLQQSIVKVNEVVVVGYAPDTTSQPDYPKADTSKHIVFTWVQQMPRYPGTMSDKASQDSLLQYLRHQLIYPAEARKDHLQGTVYVQFIVEKDGSITEPKTVSSYIGGGLEQEAIEVIRGMPKWIPGRQNGKPVTVQFSVPVKFVLQ